MNKKRRGRKGRWIKRGEIREEKGVEQEVEIEVEKEVEIGERGGERGRGISKEEKGRKDRAIWR